MWYGNQFQGLNLQIRPTHLVALAFQNGLEYLNFDFKTFNAIHFSQPTKNKMYAVVGFTPVSYGHEMVYTSGMSDCVFLYCTGYMTELVVRGCYSVIH